jgi:hypothetical protein
MFCASCLIRNVSRTHAANATCCGCSLQAGAKGQPVVFLMTDNQIVKEQFLVYINDLLSTGIVADLFTPEDKDNFCNAVRNEVKATGLLDTTDNCWDFFINKVGASASWAMPWMGSSSSAAVAINGLALNNSRVQQRMRYLLLDECAVICWTRCALANAFRNTALFASLTSFRVCLLTTLRFMFAGSALPARGAMLQPCWRQVPHPCAPVPCAGQLHAAGLVPRLAC